MRTRVERRLLKEVKLAKCRRISKVKWYNGFNYKNPIDRHDTNPDNCYFIEAPKQNSKKFYKTQSIKTIRNKYKKDIQRDLDNISLYNNGDAHKLFDYRWNIY